MPNRFWRHLCGGREVVEGLLWCATCGTPGVFHGWRLSMSEAARVYHYVHGLNPLGPHRQFADLLLGSMREPCVRCRGHTVLSLDEATWRACPTCEATGGIWNRSADEVDAAWREVVARWPDAVLPWVEGRARVERNAQQGRVGDVTQGARPKWNGPGIATAPVRGTAPKPLGSGGSASSGRSAVPRRRGYSTHGLKFSDVERAFAEAERLLGREWRLKGRGHCRRVTLDARYSRRAAQGAARSWAWVTPQGTMSARRLLPLAIVKRAARILGVPVRLLISREY